MNFVGLFANLCFLAAVTAQYGPSHGKTVVCLGLTNREIVKANRDFIRFDDMNLNLCTHIHVFNQNSYPNSQKEFWKSTSAEDEEEYEQLMNFSMKYPHLKVILIISAEQLKNYINNPQHHPELVNRTTDFILRYGFDGLDITFAHSSHIDSNKITTVLKELKKSLKPFSVLFVGSFVITKNSNKDYDLVAISKHIDYMYFAQTQHYTSEGISESFYISNVEKRLNELIASGVSSVKILMDLHFVGLEFVNQSIVTAHTYGELCNMTRNDGLIWERSYDANASLATLWNRSSGEENNKIVYESTRSVANRARLAVNLNLRGVITVIASGDDLHGKCSIDNDTFVDFKRDNYTEVSNIPKIINATFPLLRAVNGAIYLSLDKPVPEEVTANRAGLPYDTYYKYFDKFARFLNFVKSLD